MTPVYRAVVTLSAPIMRPWSRLTVTGADLVPRTGPVLLLANHESYWDPIALAAATRDRRQVRALAKHTIWKVRPIGMLMDGMGHIPIRRGVGDAEAMETAVRELRAGACIGIFPEGTRSLGRELRARSGAGRLAEAVPEAVVVCARVRGTTDVVRLPRRPDVEVEFFLPAGGGLQPGETPAAFTTRVMAEIRKDTPPQVPGRRRSAAKYRAAAERPAPDA
jgi:1-acyl-sn-glycerol-3-phosphate acyltransferase